MLFRIVNLIAFQVQWFASILGAARQVGEAGLAVGLAWMVAHTWYLTGRRMQELATIGFAFAYGLVVESAMASTGIMQLHGTFAITDGVVLPPLWLPVLWAGLGATINHSLGWLHGRYAHAAVMGAVAGPMAYAGAAHLGATVIEPSLGFYVIGAVYAVAMPALLFVAQSATREDSRPIEAGASG